MVKMSDESINYMGNIKKVILGSLISIIITIALLIVFALFLTYTSMPESTIPMVTLVITGISILIGSQISSVHIKKNGIINGMSVGLIYILTIYLLSSIISGSFGMSFFSIIMIAISIVAGAARRNNRSK